VTRATSRKVHGLTTYAVADGDVECRDGGITRIVLNFDAQTYSADGDDLDTADFTLTSGSVTSVMHQESLPGQPFMERYTVNLSGVNDDAQFILEFTAEGELGNERDYEFCWTALQGDVDGDGSVDSADETALANASDPVTESNFRADLDHDNSIEGDPSEDDWQVWSDNENDTAVVCE
jgi:hypothetical protein